MGTPLKIGVIADYNPGNQSHEATPAALEHAGQSLGLGVETIWPGPGRRIARAEFFVGSLFLPQLSSTPEQPHPLIQAFIQAAYSGKAGPLRSNSPVGKK